MISKARLKYISSLRQKKYREQHGRFLIEGIHLCEEVLKSDYQVEILLFCPPKLTSVRAKKLIKNYQNAKIPVEQLDAKSINKISGTINSQGIIGVVRKENFSLEKLLEDAPSILIALYQINDPGNLGTIIRTAAWFGVGGVLISQNSVDLTNLKVLRATMGSVFHLPILVNQNLGELLPNLKNFGYSLFVADIEGTVNFLDCKFGKRNVLLLGSEISGVCAELKKMATSILKIKKKGSGDSLNVAVAAGIILAEMSRS